MEFLHALKLSSDRRTGHPVQAENHDSPGPYRTDNFASHKPPLSFTYNYGGYSDYRSPYFRRRVYIQVTDVRMAVASSRPDPPYRNSSGNRWDEEVSHLERRIRNETGKTTI